MIEIKNIEQFVKYATSLNYRYAKTYTNFAPHEYAMAEENTKESATTISIPFINENIAEIKPAIEVQEVKEKIAAETINNKEAIKL